MTDVNKYNLNAQTNWEEYITNIQINSIRYSIFT
jgi:hypothetical protein